MSAPSYTYTLTNGSTADASQVMQDFNDILNGVSDGTKDLTINALTVNATANLKAQVNLGASSANDVQFNGSLATTIPIKTDNTYDIGTSSKGLRALYFGANSQRFNFVASASMSATWTYTLPVTAGSANQVLGQTSAGSGVGEWKTVTTDGSGTDVGVTHTANTITINLPSASATARGLMTTGTQTLAGAKTWSGDQTMNTYLGIGVTANATFPLDVELAQSTTYTTTNAPIGLIKAKNLQTGASNNYAGVVVQTLTGDATASVWGIGAFASSGTNQSTLTFKAQTAASTYVENGRVTPAGVWTVGPAASIGGTSYPGNLIVGKNDASSTGVGYVGEQFLISRLYTNGASLTSNVSANIGTSTNIVLTPGFWLVTGAFNVKATNAGTSIASIIASVSSTSATLPGTGTIGVPDSVGQYRVEWDTATEVPGNNSANTLSFSYTINISASSTLYLVGYALFTVSTAEGSGYLKANRIA